jgi:ribonuclease HI
MSYKKIKIYTDGACSGNPGPGGWGAILSYNDAEKELAGGDVATTNNRMELTGVIEALSALTKPCDVELYSDSQYVVKAMNEGWVKKWQANGWMRNKKDPALNADLWKRVLELCNIHKVSFIWVKGHADNKYNNRCDEMAVAEIKKLNIKNSGK